jgi:hypothetical protein
MDIEAIIRRYERLKATRDEYWQGLWRQVRHYCMPDQEDGLSKGGEKGGELFDTTAIEARERLASGMYSWMAPSDRRWFELRPEDKHLQDVAAVQEYFSRVSEILAMELANSNWCGELIKCLSDLACGLDGVMYVEDGGADTVLSFKSFPIETVCYSVDRHDRVDTVFRATEMSARQIVQTFGASTDAEISEEIRTAAASPDQCDRLFPILHAVLPREDAGAGLGQKAMAYADLYIDLKTRRVLQEGGYEELPFAVCRFRKSDREQYGRGPGIDALPDIRMLNRMRETFISNAEYAADPSWMIPDGSLVSKTFNRGPGALVFFRPQLNGISPAPVARGNNLQVDYQTIESERERIRAKFYWDVFDPLGDLKNMTAQEVSVRNATKMVPFAPIAGNLHTDLFGPVIQRVYAICARRGLLPEPPAQLGDELQYKIEFVSKIALSIKRQAALGWLQTESALQGLVQLNPALMDNFDVDQIARDLAAANGCETAWLLDVDKRDALRNSRQQAQQAQAQAQALGELAKSAGGLGKAPQPGSPLGQVMDAMGTQGAGQEQ